MQVNEQAAVSRGGLPVDVLHRIGTAVIADTGEFKRIVIHTAPADEHAHELAVRNIDLRSGNAARQNVEFRGLRSVIEQLFAHQQVVGGDGGGGDAVVAALLRLKGQGTRDALLDGGRENIAAVGHVADGGVFLRAEDQKAAHIEADLQNGQRQVFVVHNGLDEIGVVSAEDVIPVETEENIQILIPLVLEDVLLAEIRQRKHQKEDDERYHITWTNPRWAAAGRREYPQCTSSAR